MSWVRLMPSEIILSSCQFLNSTKDPRTIWIQRPLSNIPKGICLFLDAECYMAQVGAAPIIARMQQEDRFPPMLAAYVSSHADSLVRWTDSFCNDDFARYIATELLPWLIAEFDVIPDENILAGLSLTGLSAAHAGLKYPGVFPRVLSQSGSFWWNDTWLPQEVKRNRFTGTAFRLTVGLDESNSNTTHTNHGHQLVQVESQLDSNRRMRDALMATGHRVSYLEHPGGHDFSTWRTGLEASLLALLSLRVGA
jgi:iron(III)-enterobactin esterase